MEAEAGPSKNGSGRRRVHLAVSAGSTIKSSPHRYNFAFLHRGRLQCGALAEIERSLAQFGLDGLYICYFSLLVGVVVVVPRWGNGVSWLAIAKGIFELS